MEGIIYRNEPWSEVTGAYRVFVMELDNKVLLYHILDYEFMVSVALESLSQVAYTTKFIQFHYQGYIYSLSSEDNVLFDIFYHYLNRNRSK